MCISIFWLEMKQDPNKLHSLQAILKKNFFYNLITTVLLRTPITQMIFFNQGMLLLGSNHFLINDKNS